MSPLAYLVPTARLMTRLNDRLLTRIRSDVEAELRRKPLSRFLLQSSIAEMLDDRMDELDSAWRAFDVRIPVLISYRLDSHTLQTDSLPDSFAREVGETGYVR